MSDEIRKEKDIHVGLRFFVEIDGVQVAGFSDCSGLSVEMETMEYVEGGLNSYTHKLPVRVKYSNVTLKRGIDPGEDLYDWFKKCLNGTPIARKNVTIQVYGPVKDKVVRKWNLTRAWPVKWTAPDFKTDAGATAIETLEFAHEGITDSSKS